VALAVTVLVPFLLLLPEHAATASPKPIRPPEASKLRRLIANRAGVSLNFRGSAIVCHP
jgi:hypothetical protein